MRILIEASFKLSSVQGDQRDKQETKREPCPCLSSVAIDLRSNPSYSLPPHLISGVQCQQIKVKKNDDAELSKAVEHGCQVMMQRMAGCGFPVLLENDASLSTPTVVATVQRVVGPALLYTYMGTEKNEATSAEVENWLKRWKRGEERRALVTDENISRGWEAPAVIVIGEYQTENLVMRTSGFCLLIKKE